MERCTSCNKALRKYNKSGYCSNCTARAPRGTRMKIKLMKETSTIRCCSSCGYRSLILMDEIQEDINCKHCNIGRLEVIAIGGWDEN